MAWVTARAEVARLRIRSPKRTGEAFVGMPVVCGESDTLSVDQHRRGGIAAAHRKEVNVYVAVARLIERLPSAAGSLRRDGCRLLDVVTECIAAFRNPSVHPSLLLAAAWASTAAQQPLMPRLLSIVEAWRVRGPGHRLRLLRTRDRTPGDGQRSQLA